mgnify:CR=1 FL=1
MTKSLRFDRDGLDWPNRTASRFIKVSGLDWHVQIQGEGRPILLLHGTGASSHSWRDVMPLLATTHQVIVPDLPGHGFTKGARRADLSLKGMARAVSALLKAIGVSPELVAGHSAGAVIALELVDQAFITPQRLVSFNGAFFPIAGPIGQFFSPLAKLIASFGFLNGIFSRLVDRTSVERLLDSTGSKIDARGIDLYTRLFSDESHVSGTLTMMAEWDLSGVHGMLARLKTPLLLVKATRDKTIPPETADEVARVAACASIVTLSGFGHLAHEEDPKRAAALIGDPKGGSNVSGKDR